MIRVVDLLSLYSTIGIEYYTNVADASSKSLLDDKNGVDNGLQNQFFNKINLPDNFNQRDMRNHSNTDSESMDQDNMLYDKLNQCYSISQLNEYVVDFDGCSFKKYAKNTVFSDGNPESDIMLIGEAPGFCEDERGIPFCGASGMLLDKMLSAIGLNRSCVYITNVIFWRPEGNRKPTESEVDLCLPFVERHIFLFNPKLIVLLGSTSANALIDKSINVSKMRGKIHYYSNKYLTKPVRSVVTYHPSYLLRQPLQKKESWKDFLYIKNILMTN